jgi:cyclin A
LVISTNNNNIKSVKYPQLLQDIPVSILVLICNNMKDLMKLSLISRHFSRLIESYIRSNISVNDKWPLYNVKSMFDIMHRRQFFYFNPMDYVTNAKNISINMRSFIIDWLVDITEKINCGREIIFLTVNIIDRYLSIKHKFNINQIKLLAITSMWIAIKVEDIDWTDELDKASKLIEKTNSEEFCTKKGILKMESNILTVLNYNLHPPTIIYFGRFWANIANICGKSYCYFNYISELTILNYEFSFIPPTVLAASCLYITKRYTEPGKPPWNLQLEYYTHYTVNEIAKCINMLVIFILAQRNTKLTAIKRKWNTTSYFNCSTSVTEYYFQV